MYNFKVNFFSSFIQNIQEYSNDHSRCCTYMEFKEKKTYI